MSMNILIADSSKELTDEIKKSWNIPGTELLFGSDSESIVSTIKHNRLELAFIEVPFLTFDSMDLVSYLKEKDPGIEIFVLCDKKNWPGATSAVSRGANSFLMKPVSVSQLESIAKKIKTQYENKNTHQLMENQVLDSLLGDTPEMRKILKTVYKVAPTTSTVLITGESGTGKEFLANVVHRYSKRTNEPFVAVNCGAIPENLVESELFGAKKGAYTGSTADKKGLFESANGGTLFLDEVGELSQATQVKLLRFLQSHEIRRVGETEARILDVRIIAATNRNLKSCIAEGSFREDLYYRLNTFHMELPPLKERRSVIPTLVHYFILKYKETHGKDIVDLEQSAQYALAKYPYPGNIRELENIIEHAIVLSENGIIRLEDLPEEVQEFARDKTIAIPHMKADSEEEPRPRGLVSNRNERSAQKSGKTASEETEELLTLEEMERRHILHALSVCNDNKSEVCKRLGISRATLWRKLKELKIQMEEFDNAN